MSSQIDYTINELRRRILSGQVTPGERMVELELSAQLAVSRTPIRIALGELEKEGLLERLPTRGFRVRQFRVDEVADAVDVRGALEGMAARRAAERGISPQTQAELQACIDEGRLLLENAAAAGHLIDAARWVPMNARFHAALVDAAGNSTLAPTTKAPFSIVPAQYLGHLIGMDCQKCHESAQHSAREFDRRRGWYGHVSGNRTASERGGGILSFHFLDPRRLDGVTRRNVPWRPTFVAGGLVERYDAAKHPAEVYQRID